MFNESLLSIENKMKKQNHKKTTAATTKPKTNWREESLKAKFQKVKSDCSQAGFHQTILGYKGEPMFHFSSKAGPLVSSPSLLASPCWAARALSSTRHGPAGGSWLSYILQPSHITLHCLPRLPTAAASPHTAELPSTRSSEHGSPLLTTRDGRRQRQEERMK